MKRRKCGACGRILRPEVDEGNTCAKCRRIGAIAGELFDLSAMSEESRATVEAQMRSAGKLRAPRARQPKVAPSGPLTAPEGPLSFVCPRCGQTATEEFYGPCRPCREELKA